MTGLESALVREAAIDPAVVARANERRRDGRSLSGVLLDMGALTHDRYSEIAAAYCGIPFVHELSADDIPTELLSALPIQYAKKNRLVPLEKSERAVTVAVADPVSGLVPIDDLRVLYGLPIHAVVAPPRAVEDAIHRAYDRLSRSTEDIVDGLDDEPIDLVATELEEPRDLIDSDDEGPIIRLVNSLIFQSAKDGASDIHVEPFERELIVRARVDGILYDLVKPPKRFQPIIISRIKIMAGLDIAEKRLPQDGRIRSRVAGRDIDIRVSVLPTAFGERVVMRLLDRSSTLLPLEDLGLAGSNQDAMVRLIHQSHGIILVTGPTGSGKTTTLYACLQKINSKERNIITVEDPIEYQLAGVGQMQVNPKIDLTFANGLRSILRQDPDVIMVGEIRDTETAEIAIHASLTGHLVFSTLHTNDAPGAISRLVDMGIEPFLVSSSLIGVVAQRLVRRVCPDCREAYDPTPEQFRQVGLSPDVERSGPIYRTGPGCPRCKHKGYTGRCGIHEMILINDEIRALVTANSDAATIRRAATASGMLNLRQDGALKALQGTTTFEEVLRVAQEDLGAE